MTMLPADGACVARPQSAPPVSVLEKVLRGLSVFTACLWFVYGIQKRDKTIYLACVGWVVLDAAIVAGVIVHR